MFTSNLWTKRTLSCFLTCPNMQLSRINDWQCISFLQTNGSYVICWYIYRLDIDYILHYQPSSFNVPVILHLAGRTVNVEKLMDKVFVHAFKVILEVHHHVDQNVL